MNSIANLGLEELVIAISLTTQISDTDMVQFTCPQINLALKTPKDYTIKYIDQLNQYAFTIYNLLNEAQTTFPNLKKIHLVYSGQSCLAFEVGKRIEDRRWAEIINYHYERTTIKKYPWGIIINGTKAGQFVLA